MAENTGILLGHTRQLMQTQVLQLFILCLAVKIVTLFTVNDETGALTFTNAPNFENPGCGANTDSNSCTVTDTDMMIPILILLLYQSQLLMPECQ